MAALGPDLEGATVLDLFAGSGALGFEALSRGAERTVFVERWMRSEPTPSCSVQSPRWRSGVEMPWNT